MKIPPGGDGLKKRKILTMIIVFFLFVFSWTLYQNKALGTTIYEIDCSSQPELSGFTIVQISDLHNEEFGENQKKLLQKLEKCNPDMIAVTGDFIDCRNPNVDIAMEFIEGAVDIAPVYYVPGNHERWIYEEYQKLCDRMEEAGVHLMADNLEVIEYQGKRILCMGVKDPDFYDVDGSYAEAEMIRKDIQQFEYVEEDFALLLSHRPELFEIYAEEQLDVVLAGHAHGGQFRLPFIGGLAAPNQGIFPEYDAGMFTKESTHMIVSRGIGNSIIPLRFNNPPEIVVVKLTTE